MRWLGLAVLCGAIIGCHVKIESKPTTEPDTKVQIDTIKPKGPKIGDKVIFPGYFADLWPSPEDLKAKTNLLKFLGTGTLIEVLAIDDEWVAVDVIRDERNRPINMHGYIKRWW